MVINSTHQHRDYPNRIRVLMINDGDVGAGEIQTMLMQSDLPNLSLDCISETGGVANALSANAHDVCIVDSCLNHAGAFLDLAGRVASVIPLIVLTSNCAEEVIEAFHHGAADCIIRQHLTADNLELSICKVLLDERAMSLKIDNEQRYLSLIENSKDAIYTHDLEGNFLSANPAAETLTGYSLEELLTMNARSLVAHDYVKLLDFMLQRKLEEQKETSYEIELLTKTGQKVPVRIDSHLIYRAGKPVEVQGIVCELTYQRKIGTNIRNRREQDRAFV